ncbi:hypothetical protein [Filifactor villosus]|uniref:Lipoprotein n=1 Tax=Filifactor villosus TaxID=29374 RepID=A0ABV9QKF9_9FIRM
MNKKRFLATALTLVLLVVAGCSSKSATADEVLEKAKGAANKVETVRLKNEITQVDTQGGTTNQLMEADLMYDLGTKEIKKGKGSISYKTENSEEDAQIKFTFVGDPDHTFIQEISQNGEVKREEATGPSYEIAPEYFTLLDILYSIKGDLEVTEESDGYHLKLSNKDMELIPLFAQSYNLRLSGVEESEVEKEFEAVFEKDTFFFKELKFLIKYDGDKGKFELGNHTMFSEWNSLDIDVENK